MFEDKEFVAGENVTVSEDGAAFVSEAYGAAKVGWNSVSVSPCVRIGGDGLSAQMMLYPTLSDNSALSPTDAMRALDHAGVVHGV